MAPFSKIPAINPFWVLALSFLFVSPLNAADDNLPKKQKKKPGNEAVDKETAKEKKALAKLLEKQGIESSSVNDSVASITPADRREALRTIQAIQAFVQAVGKADQANQNSSPQMEKLLANRPAKLVTKPNLNPADIDALMEKALSKAGVTPAPLTDDATFLRRASLDLTGIIPSPEEIAEFEKSDAPDKRAKVVEKLIDSDAFAANWAKYWRDVIRFRATETQPRRFPPLALETYFREKIAANTPWDEVARELITTLGPNDEKPATLLTMAQESKAEETAGEVSRVFMGIQIQCAQCHDHPTDSWKRDQFQQFAAFFSGVRSANFSSNQVKAGQRVFGVRPVGQPNHQVANPKDPADMQQFAPKFFLSESAPELPINVSVESRRALAASYIASQDNPWFAKAFVNRIWYALMGDTFYMPIDDLGPDREGKNLEVLESIASAWTKTGYDVKWLFRTLTSTQTYQRQSRESSSSSSEAELSGANCPTRLRADQILQNLRQVTGFPIVGLKPQAQGPRARSAAIAKAKAAGVPPQLQGPVGRAALKSYQTFAFDPSTPDDEVVGTIPQALFLMNAPDLNMAVEARPGSVLGKILDQYPKDDDAALKALYDRVLARDPNTEELKIAHDFIRQTGDRKQAFEDLYWSLLNSAEFMSRR